MVVSIHVYTKKNSFCLLKLGVPKLCQRGYTCTKLKLQKVLNLDLFSSLDMEC